jgi:biopolymer transport protein TolR
VMLVLVVILMVAVPFVVPSVVELPTVDRAGQQQDTPVRVVLRADGRVSLLADGVDTPLNAGELVAAVRQRQQGRPGTPVVIEADASVQYRAVMAAVSELRRAGVERVGLAVVSGPERR